MLYYEHANILFNLTYVLMDNFCPCFCYAFITSDLVQLLNEKGKLKGLKFNPYLQTAKISELYQIKAIPNLTKTNIIIVNSI